MMNREPCKCAPYLLSVMRIVLGLLFMYHGSQKLFGYPGGGHPVAWTSRVGVAGILELFGGALIVLGLFTRCVAFVLSGEMAFAYFMVHAKRGLWPPISNGGELAVVYCFVFFYLSGSGGGAWSLDRLLQGSKPPENKPPETKPPAAQ
jgi:putative oxidoreductase